VGAIVGSMLSQSVMPRFKMFEHFVNMRDRAAFMAAGIAAGFGSALGSPIGVSLQSTMKILDLDHSSN